MPTPSPFRAGDRFSVAGLPGQRMPDGPPVVVEVTGVGTDGRLSLLVLGSSIAPESAGAVGFADAALLVEHGAWLPVDRDGTERPAQA